MYVFGLETLDFGEMVNPPLLGTAELTDLYMYSEAIGAEDQEIEFEEGYVTFTKKFENFGPGCDEADSELHEVTKNGKILQAWDIISELMISFL